MMKDERDRVALRAAIPFPRELVGFGIRVREPAHFGSIADQLRDVARFRRPAIKPHDDFALVRKIQRDCLGRLLYRLLIDGDMPALQPGSGFLRRWLSVDRDEQARCLVLCKSWRCGQKSQAREKKRRRCRSVHDTYPCSPCDQGSLPRLRRCRNFMSRAVPSDDPDESIERRHGLFVQGLRWIMLPIRRDAFVVPLSVAATTASARTRRPARTAPRSAPRP